MPWNNSYLADLDAIVTVYSGVLSAETLLEAIQSTLTLARQHGTKNFLADCSTLEGGHSVVNLYELAKLLETAAIPMDFREAIVLPQLDAPASDVRFWETTCRNRGFDVRVFKTVVDATAWLVESTLGKTV